MQSHLRQIAGHSLEMYIMTRRFHVLNTRLLLAFLVASLGMAGLAGEVAAQTGDDSVPVAEASPAGTDGESGAEESAVSALPETGQGPTETADAAPVLLLAGIAGVIAVAGVMLFRTRRA